MHSIFRGGASLHWAVIINENNHNLFEQKVKTLIPGYCETLQMTNMTQNKQKEHERVLPLQIQMTGSRNVEINDQTNWIPKLPKSWLQEIPVNLNIINVNPSTVPDMSVEAT